jgi:hypothetical protein
MPTPPLSRAEGLRRVEAIERALREGYTPPGTPSPPGQFGAVAVAGQRLGLHGTLGMLAVQRFEAAAGRGVDWSLWPGNRRSQPVAARFDPPQIPDGDVPVDELIEKLERNYARRSAHVAAKKWMRFALREDGPYMLAVVGDPHLDDPGCNWPLLRRDVELMRRPHTHAVCLGDVTNNWSGRLVRLYAEQETTRSQAWKLSEWFFRAVPWLVIVAGNHDMWSSSHGSGDPLDWMARGHAVKEDWLAQFEVSTPDGHVVRVDARHDFKGSSIYNPVHGLMRAQKFGDGSADILVAGHQHHAEIYCGQDPGKSSRPFWLVRARGYKHIDAFADQHQYESQASWHGSTVGIVVDPSRPVGAQVHAYTDLAEAAEILQFKRARWEAATCQNDAEPTTTRTGQKRPRTQAK